MTPQSPSLDFLGEGGAMGEGMRAHDWSTSPLGDPESWPTVMKALVAVMLASNQAMFIAWGPARTLLYNDRYAEILHDRHPQALGKPFAEVWRDIMAVVGPIIDRAFAGEATQMDDITLMVTREGKPQETHFSFSYTPVYDESGRVAGMFCACSETTEAVFSRRRKDFRLTLDDRLRAAEQPIEALENACALLGATLDATLCAYGEVDDAANSEIKAEWRRGRTASALGRHRLADYGAERVADLLSGLPVLVADVDTDPRTAGTSAEQSYRALGCRASLDVPFVRNGQVRALLTVSTAEPRAWSQRDVDLALETVQRSWFVAERLRAEVELRASEERFRAAIDAVQGILWTNNASGEMEGDQPGWAALTGQSYDQYHGYGWSNAIHPDDAQATMDAWNAAVAARETFVFEHRVCCRDNSWRLFAVRAVPILDAAGAVRQWVGVHTDVTQQRADEESLRSLNADLERQVIERTQSRGRSWAVTPDLMGALNPDGFFETSNPAWHAVLGWSEDEIRRTPFWDLVHPDDVDRSRAEFESTLRGTLAIQFANRFRTRDGTYRWISWMSVPEDGMVYCTGRDITAEREREAELALAREALRQSQKMEAMGQLTGGVAHDFNNLLTPIVYVLDLMQNRGIGTEREQRLIAGAAQSATRATTLVHRLLSFARRQPLQSKPVDLPVLIHGITDLLVSTVGPQIEVSIAIDDDLPAAKADPHQLEMALVNLAVNARDAMPGGGVLRLEATIDHIDRDDLQGMTPGRYVRLSLTDSGIGMDEATLARAVEPFFSTKDIGKGTGLGLSMVHGLVSQLGGGMRVESDPGHGTTVHLWFPAMEHRRAEPIAANAMNGTTDRARVLLVDDDDAVRSSTADMLIQLGHRVTDVSSAGEGLALIDAGESFDLVVSDHLMAGMTGIELASEVKSRRARLPVLIVSGYADLEGIAADLPRLTKPFKPLELEHKIAEVLAG